MNDSSSDEGYSELSSETSTIAFSCYDEFESGTEDEIFSEDEVGEFMAQWQCADADCHTPVAFPEANEISQKWLDWGICDIMCELSGTRYLICRQCNNVYHKTCVAGIDNNQIYEDFICCNME